jgi:aminopeptidase N
LNTSDQILLRGKGSFVFWMLRDMLGDSTLQNALSAYRPANDTSTAYFQGLLEEGGKRNLEWFFDDWVYRDRGLPNFHIENVYARPMLGDPNKLSLVTVTLENRGGAGAEVPVTVQSATGERALRILVPAHQKTSERLQLPDMPTRAIVNDGSVPVPSSSEGTFDVPVKAPETDQQ